jgi:hypothetical protein
MMQISDTFFYFLFFIFIFLFWLFIVNINFRFSQIDAALNTVSLASCVLSEFLVPDHTQVNKMLPGSNPFIPIYHFVKYGLSISGYFPRKNHKKKSVFFSIVYKSRYLLNFIKL